MISRICTTVIAAGVLAGGVVAAQTAAPSAAPAPAPAATAGGAQTSQDELFAFIAAAAATKPGVMHVTSMSAPGSRNLPLVVIGSGLADGSAKTVRSASATKTRVWVQAASREGTEAAIMLLRDLAAGRNELWLTSVILLVSPADVSADARDHLALSSPDTLALTQALIDYDPHATVEVRTEAGPCTAYGVTVAPPLHPNTSEHVLGVMRDEWVPFIFKQLKSKWSVDAFYQGTVEGGSDGCAGAPEPAPAAAAGGRRGAAPASGRSGRSASAGRAAAAARGAAADSPPAPVAMAWRAPSEHLSVMTNYLGVRNRFALTGVVSAHAAAADRRHAASRFLEEALAFTWAASARLKKACEDADRQLLVGRSLPTSARPSTMGEIDVLLSGPRSEDDAETPAPPHPVTMRDRLRYETEGDAVLAAEYLLPAEDTATVELLRRHGIQLRQLTQPTKGVEEFVVAAGADPSTGGWKPSAAEVPAGTWVVRMNQPLARLAFLLIEPTSSEAAIRVLPDPSKSYRVMRRR